MSDDDNPCQRFWGWQNRPIGSILVDSPTLQRNLARMQRVAAQGKGRILSPHIRAPFRLPLITAQKQYGATGFTVHRPTEAEALLRHGVTQVTLSAPLPAPDVAQPLVPYAVKGALRLVVETAQDIASLAKAASEIKQQAIDVLLKINPDDGSGSDPLTPLQLYEQTARIEAVPALRYAGLFGAFDPPQRQLSLLELRDFAARNFDRLRHFAKMAPVKSGPQVVAIGATLSLFLGQDLGGITEIHPCNYGLFDLQAVHYGLAARDQIAMAITANVTPLNANQLEIDVGHISAGAPSAPGELWLPYADAPLILPDLAARPLLFSGAQIGQAAARPGPALILPQQAIAMLSEMKPAEPLVFCTAPEAAKQEF